MMAVKGPGFLIVAASPGRSSPGPRVEVPGFSCAAEFLQRRGLRVSLPVESGAGSCICIAHSVTHPWGVKLVDGDCSRWGEDSPRKSLLLTSFKPCLCSCLAV